MRKILLLLCAGGMSLGLQGQITLTQNDVGAVGSSFEMGTDTSVAGYDIGQPGTGNVWDFADLSAHSRDTIVFEDPAATPYGADFPGANLAIKDAGLDGYAYLTSSASGLEVIGFAGDPFGMGQAFIVPLNPPTEVVRFPFTYGDAFLDTTILDITIDGSQINPLIDSVRYHSTQNRDLQADAAGSLTLYSGTYDAIRVKEIVETHDSIWALSFGNWFLFQDSSYTDSTFTWWANNEGYMMAEAPYIGGQLTEMNFQDPPAPVGRPDMKAEDYVSLFPTPASGHFFVEKEDPAVVGLDLYNVQGILLRQSALTGSRTQIDVRDLPPGAYLYRLRDKHGAILASGKVLLN